MLYPMQSPTDPADLPVGEVPAFVAVPPQARQILTEAGLADAADEGLLRGRLDELDVLLTRAEWTLREARGAVADLLRVLDRKAGVEEREACE